MLLGCSTFQKKKLDDSYHLESRADSILFRRYDPLIKLHHGKSGIVPLKSGQDALESRVRSIREAQYSIDIQYYIWKDDDSGLVLLKELITAAARGVRVRLLLDNFNESRYQVGLKILDQKPNIEVRLIDTNFKYLNRRMHNKSFTVDNQLSIVGGRNVGDEYFGLSKESNFKDYDVFMIGPVVDEVSYEFDQYWNCNRSYAVSEKIPTEKRDLRKAQKRIADVEDYILKSQVALEKVIPFWSEAHLVYDPPEKLEGKSKENLSMKLRPGITNLEKELLLVSPYFVPGRRGMKTLKELRQRNVRIVILTNSLSSTDVLSTFAGYKKYRKNLLKMGVEIYEFKTVGEPKNSDVLGASSSIGLHGKVLIGDRQKMFVGSMNLDPRSIDLNTEMGVVIFSPKMAHDTAEKLLKSLPDVAYGVVLEKEKIVWKDSTKDGEIIHTSEPGETRWKNFKLKLSSWLIPEQML
jgi:putative cardiolipin synthase